MVRHESARPYSKLSNGEDVHLVPGVPVKWKCDMCECVNAKHPAFNVYIPNRKNAIDPFTRPMPPGAAWECTGCHHPMRNHGFYFEGHKIK